jgi:hypothetical protein
MPAVRMLRMLHHMTSNVLVQIVKIALEKENCAQFLYQLYSSFLQEQGIDGYTP